MQRKSVERVHPIWLLGLVCLVGFGCGDDDDENGGPGGYDGTCYDCSTVCVNCTDASTCTSECARVQGYSDGFMWLEGQLTKWGCDDVNHSDWTSITCP